MNEKESPDVLAVGYTDLHRVLMLAYSQSAHGKGKERHANEKPFTKQPIMEIGRLYGTGFNAGQVAKKLQEAQGMAARGEHDKAMAEALGAIVYSASVYLLLEEAGMDRWCRDTIREGARGVKPPDEVFMDYRRFRDLIHKGETSEPNDPETATSNARLSSLGAQRLKNVLKELAESDSAYHALRHAIAHGISFGIDKADPEKADVSRRTLDPRDVYDGFNPQKGDVPKT